MRDDNGTFVVEAHTSTCPYLLTHRGDDGSTYSRPASPEEYALWIEVKRLRRQIEDLVYKEVQ